MFRYLAFVWNSASKSRREDTLRFLERARTLTSNWHTVLDQDGIRVLCINSGDNTNEPYMLFDRTGVVIGTLFRRNTDPLDPSPSGRPVLEESESAKIVATQGRHLVEKYWGRYVAFLVDPVSRKKWILKDPTGDFPCYSTTAYGVTIYFSALSDILPLQAVRFSINWPHVCIRLATANSTGRRTTLNEVDEVFGGQVVTIEGERITVGTYWSPCQIANSNIVESSTDAIRMLRSATKACIGAWASRHSHVLLRLSGGLDSSIVLRCLTDSPSRPYVTCLTYFLPGSKADERPWARLAVKGTNCEHLEIARDPAQISFADLLRVQDAPKPECNRSFLEYGRLEQQQAIARNATVVCDGNPGDALFGNFARRHVVSDLLWRHGPTLRALTVASHAARMLDRSLWEMLALGIREGILRRQLALMQDTILKDRRLLSNDTMSVALRNPDLLHPWLCSLNQASPGLALPVYALVVPRPLYDPLLELNEWGPERLSPLMSQPLVELCLRIPSYIHMHGGHDRAIARAAFSPDLPREIVKREWKDRGPGGYERRFLANLHFCRELLLDGILVREGLIDKRCLEETLSGEPSKRAAHAVEIADCVTVEAWLRRWTDVRQRMVA